MTIKKGTPVWTSRGLEIVTAVTRQGTAFTTRPATQLEKLLFKIDSWLGRVKEL